MVIHFFTLSSRASHTFLLPLGNNKRRRCKYIPSGTSGVMVPMALPALSNNLIFDSALNSIKF